EVWFDLGALYEACNNQVNDAIDAYTRAAELDRTNSIIEQRLEVLRRMQAGQPVPTGASQGPAPIDPPTGPTTAGQPNAPGGPSGESGPHGSVPGSLGAPPMAGPAGSGVPQPPEQHMRHPSESQRGGPPPPGMQQQQHPGQGAMQPMPQQQHQQQPPAPAQQKMPPQHQQGGAPMPGGRPGYIDEGAPAAPYGGRYDGPPRSEAATSGGAPIPSPHYPMQQGPQAGAGPYQAGAAPYTSAPYAQPPTSRPYSTSSQPPSAGVYGPQPQQQGAQYRPGDERREPSRTGSPMVPQQQQFQRQQPPPPHQTTSSSERTPTSGTFHPGSVNGYGPYPGQPALSDTRRHSRSPSQPQSATYRQQQQQQRQIDEKPAIYGNRFPENTNMPPPTSLPSFSQDAPRSELRTPVAAADRDGDATALKSASPTKVSPSKSPVSADTPASQSSSAIASASMAAAPISLPQVAMPTPTSASSDGHGNALSGPTAAPIRLPPVQFGGNGNFGSPSNRSPLNAVSSASQQAAADDATKSGGSGPLSLASAITTDDDNEGSAINSLMSLSNVATTMTSRPQSTPAQQQPISPRAQDAAAAAA
ncbi:glucose repression mediator protein, partial [Linderina macrospora]